MGANTGNTVVFPNHNVEQLNHIEAINFLTCGCSVAISWSWPRYESDVFGLCAREKGYDSIQFEAVKGEGQAKTGTFGKPGLFEMVLVNSDGHNTCGTDDASQTEFRSGWMASRRCDCENIEIPDACGGWPDLKPFSDPPLCELAHREPWRVCDPTICPQTTCKLPTSK